MRFITITTFAVAGRLLALAVANPVPNSKAAGGMAIPLVRHSSFLNANKSIDLDAVSSHGILVREKILRGLDNYEMNTGTMHPFAVERSESKLGTRPASVSLTTYENHLWMGEILIGTPPKTLNVQIDTGSADMWVLQAGCDGISGDRESDLWFPDSSASSVYMWRSFRLEYSDESIVKGDRYTDIVTIAGFTIDPQSFGSATSYTSPTETYEYPADGLLGLAFPSISVTGAVPLFESLVRQNKAINPTFSFKLSSSGAEMYLGGANSMLYNGDITYTPVTHPGFWQVSMDSVRVNGKTILDNIPVIFDTGATYIYGDWERVSELFKSLDGALEEHGDFGYYYLPCNSFPTLSFTFGGKAFEIPPEALKLNPVEEGSPDCFSAVIAQRSRIEFWNIGITFLQGVYTVFNYSDLQVGFAKLA